MLLAEPQKACCAGVDSENWDPNIEGLQQEGRVKNLVEVFENMKLHSEIQKVEIKGGHKEFNKKDNGKAGRLGHESLKSNGCVKRWASPGMDQPLARRQPNIFSGKNCSSFDRHCNMGKYEDVGNTSDFSDTQSLRSSALSESSSRSRRRTEKSFDSTKRGSPIWKNRAERHKKQLTVTPTRPFRLLTEERGQMKEKQFMKKIQHKMDEEEKHRIPIAQGLPWTTNEPHVLPKPPVKEHTRPLNVKLCTESRAVERAKFDYSIDEKYYYREQQRLDEEHLRKLAELEEIKRLRKEMIPYAQLMPSFDHPFVPKKSSKPPTIPKEPKFHSYLHTKGCNPVSRMKAWFSRVGFTGY
jgi:hypothetical protein